jgi:hypothetical protein
LRHQSLDHPFAVGKVILSPTRPVVGLGLTQVQRAAHLAGTLTFLARGLPVPFQRAPHRLPILRGRFHDYFFDFLLDQPLGQHV